VIVDKRSSARADFEQYAIPAMERNEGQWRGSIVNLSSVAGIRGGNPHLLYPTSKGAIVNMTRAMAHQHAKERIRYEMLPRRSLVDHTNNVIESTAYVSS
jgi:short-subunit dehydrogenase